MSEKKTTTLDDNTWLTRSPQLPFVGNTDEVAAQIVRDIYAYAPRQKFIATISNVTTTPIVLRENDAVNFTYREEIDSVLVEETEVTLTALEMEGLSLRALPADYESAETLNPPAALEFLLVLCAKSSRNKAAVGDINERFGLDYTKWGRARACRRYSAETLQFLFPLLIRTIGRALKLAAVIDVIKRNFLG